LQHTLFETNGDKISENPFRHASVEYKCHDCSDVIRVGDLYYNRRTDFTILCIPCYEARNKRWRQLRDTSDNARSMLRDLRRAEQTSRELQERYGTRYISLLRKLTMKGHPIWKTSTHGQVTYRLEEDNHSTTRCRFCGRFFSAAPDTMAVRGKLCPDCLASEGILSPIRKRSERSRRSE